ncbi:MAG: RNA polymerase sigma factor [Acidimicrobiales bacterium]
MPTGTNNSRITSSNADVARLVSAAAAGDELAWARLVDRYASLVWSVARRFGLNRRDAEDVSQTVWLRLAEHLDRIREPACLPGWLAVTTRHVCCSLVRHAGRVTTTPELGENDSAQTVEFDGELLEDERRRAVERALGQLSPSERRLLALLCADPGLSYADIADALGVPIGSIGPTRMRIIAKLRRHPAVQQLAEVA